jgi:hypothetical protein
MSTTRKSKLTARQLVDQTQKRMLLQTVPATMSPAAIKEWCQYFEKVAEGRTVVSAEVALDLLKSIRKHLAKRDYDSARLELASVRLLEFTMASEEALRLISEQRGVHRWRQAEAKTKRWGEQNREELVQKVLRKMRRDAPTIHFSKKFTWKHCSELSGVSMSQIRRYLETGAVRIPPERK